MGRSQKTGLSDCRSCRELRSISRYQECCRANGRSVLSPASAQSHHLLTVRRVCCGRTAHEGNE